MKISRALIKNFRSILETDFSLDNIVTGIAGGNESGKSNGLRALKKFLDGENFEEDDQYQLSKDLPYISLTFSELNEDESSKISWLLRREGQIKELKVWRVGNEYFIDDNLIDDILKKEEDDRLQKIEELKAEKIKIDELKAQASEQDGDGEVETIEQVDSPASAEVDTEPLPPATKSEIILEIRKMLPKCELISDISSLIVGRNIEIKKIYSERYETEDEKNKYETIRALLKIGDIAKEDLTEKDTNKRIQILRKKSSIISQEIDKAWSQEDVKIQLIADTSHLVIHFRDGKNMPKNREDDTQWIWTLPENRSFGFRWYVTFYAKYLSRIRNTHDQNMLFLIDDAGLGLNKAAQDDLLKELSKITTNDPLVDKGMKQVIYVSHSKYMFSWDIRNQVLVANKGNGQGTKLNDFWWQKYSKNNLPSPLDEIGLNWSEDLLSKNNVVVEGHSDGYIINFLISRFNDRISINDVLCGFKLIPGNTIEGQYKLADLCKIDGRGCLLLFDSDLSGKDGYDGAVSPSKGFNASQIGLLTHSPVMGRSYVTIEDFLPIKDYIVALNARGASHFKDRWEQIERLHRPDILSDGIVAAIKKRLERGGYTPDEIKSFLRSKYYIALSVLEKISVEDFEDDQVVAITNLFTDLNSRLMSIKVN